MAAVPIGHPATRRDSPQRPQVQPASARSSPQGPSLPPRFADQPLLVFWEMTKACPLACVHCRAVAQAGPLPGELSTAEGRQLISELGSTRRPHPVLILTGGDCLARPDLPQLVAHARQVGVPVALAPAVSPRLTSDLMRQLRGLGVTTVALSLDGATAATHDGVRGVPGHFATTLRAVRTLQSMGFRVQVDTTVMPATVGELGKIAVLLHHLGVRVWEVFFLVNVGRGDALAEIDPEEAEDVCHFLVEASRSGLVVRTVEAPFFRRVVHQRAVLGDNWPVSGAVPAVPAAPGSPIRPAGGSRYRQLTAALSAGLGPPTTAPKVPTLSTRDGTGVVFVGHDGAVYPSGFLPLSLGNVRHQSLLDVYRDHPLLLDIRAGRFPGRCGHCTYTDLCGGSRARAYASAGDPLADDPACLATR